MEMIADTGQLRSMDVMELNPALDVRNKTARVAVDLIESLFGKSTLIRRPTELQHTERTLQHVEPRRLERIDTQVMFTSRPASAQPKSQ